MTKKLHASRVSRQLADAGHQRSTVDDRHGWTPGFRVEQCGAQVVVSCEGPLGKTDPDAETERLAEYALVLTNLGYEVETVPRPVMDELAADRCKLIVQCGGSDG